MILANSDFCKDFEKCVTLYKELMKQSSSIPSETMRVLEVSSGGRGGSGSKKTEDGYYTKDEHSKLSCEQKGKLNKIREKRGSNSGGGGSSEPKPKIRKLANQRKKDLRTRKYLKANIG